MSRTTRIVAVIIWLLIPAGAVSQTLVSPPELVATVTTPEAAFEVVLSGHYALVPDYGSGLEIIDVSSPANPFLVGNLDTPGYAVHCASDGTYAYVADHAVGGLQVVSIATPSAPSEVGSYVSGDVAVMAALHNGLVLVGYVNGGLDIVDVSTPSQPALVSSFGTVGAPRHAIFDGDIVYIAEYVTGLLVLDLTDPTAPDLVTILPVDRPLGVDRVGETLFLACADGLHTINVADPSSPVPLDRVAVPGPAIKVVVTGNYALLADHVAGGLQVVDVSDPTDITVSTSYVTGQYAHGIAAAGDHAFLADGGGLKVLRVFDSSVPVEPTSFGRLKARYRSN